ncbi:MAG: ABC transporter ATP-binding protein [Rhodocyclaceae bacterium]|nr:ABC transporter ATP-binding protein [Rhodocyclaceae bacterium]MBK9312068.1 ABC transporter ATP-binding protein [Rhodocyclaceae bacterium]MBK9956270.1 ABC transporter ATP-binding protein [Rhodocyclaceae bacterium]
MTERPGDVLLEARGLTRHFGGLAANSNVSMTLRRGEIHALLGPNGAGKSTFINMLSGDLPPSSGTILLKGDDVTALSAHRRSRIGIGRSFQRTNIFPTFSVQENCVLAAQSRQQQPGRIFRPPLQNEAVVARSHEVMALAGLNHCASQIAGTLSHGEQRQLEIAMVLATNPAVLLLDEPLAGMGAEESSRMVDLLARLRRDHAILLVEHDMDAVFALADVITVLVNGELLESGPPEQIKASPAVRSAYLGEDEGTDYA